MKFTPAQARSIAGVSEETLRYWKRFLPALKGKRGHSPSYTHGELLALMVINLLVRDFTVDISRIAHRAEELFAICHQTQWLKYREGILSLRGNELEIHQEAHLIAPFVAAGPCILVPLGQIMEQLKANLISQDPETQLELNWPPLGIASRKGVGK